MPLMREGARGDVVFKGSSGQVPLLSSATHPLPQCSGLHPPLKPPSSLEQNRPAPREPLHARASLLPRLPGWRGKRAQEKERRRDREREGGEPKVGWGVVRETGKPPFHEPQRARVRASGGCAKAQEGDAQLLALGALRGCPSLNLKPWLRAGRLSTPDPDPPLATAAAASPQIPFPACPLNS